MNFIWVLYYFEYIFKIWIISVLIYFSVVENMKNEGFISLEDDIKFKDMLRKMIHDAFKSHMYKYTIK